MRAVTDGTFVEMHEGVREQIAKAVGGRLALVPSDAEVTGDLKAMNEAIDDIVEGISAMALMAHREGLANVTDHYVALYESLETVEDYQEEADA